MTKLFCISHGNVEARILSKESFVLDNVQRSGKDSRGCLVLQAPGSKWLSITGDLSFVMEKKKIDEVWSEHLKVYFPQGKEDPNLVLIKFVSHWAEYWDQAGIGKKLSYTFQAGKAYLQGEKLEPEKQTQLEHAKVSLETAQ